MYIHNSSAFYHAPEHNPMGLASIKEANTSTVHENYLRHFSEKAQISFQTLSAGIASKEKAELITTLNSIGKAAAFASMNGFESQEERLIVSQYFGNFDGVLSDEAIRKMIFSRLNNPNQEHREFLQNFAQALEEPLRHIDITV